MHAVSECTPIAVERVNGARGTSHNEGAGLRRITRTRGSMASAMDYSWPVVVDDRLPFCMGLRRVGEAEGRHGD